MGYRRRGFKGFCLALSFACLGSMALASCGYRFVGSGGFPGGAQRIYTTIFENHTSETGLENIVARELNDEFTRRNKNGFAGRKRNADAILKGKIKNLRIDIVSRRSEKESAERRVTFSADIRLVLPEGQEIWTVTGITATQAYPVIEGDTLATEASKREALRLASAKLAETIYNRLIEDF